MTLRLRRSELSTPASSPKMFEKAMGTAADMVFLDLEDAVAPAQKEAARRTPSRRCAISIGAKKFAPCASTARTLTGRMRM